MKFRDNCELLLALAWEYNLYIQGVTEYVRPAWKADRTPSKQ